jgi:enamine deaminase RidA (YjgF/YER057c/UK114 family)
MSDPTIVLPKGWKRPRGWSNGVVRGDQLHVAGQFGWNPADQTFASDDFGDQWRGSLLNVLAVVTAAGGEPACVDSLRVYVLDLEAYRGASVAVAEGWRSTFDAHFPAITMVQVSALTEARAVVEIEATATLKK